MFHDRLFVTDWTTHRLLELSTEVTHVRDVISDTLEYPQGVAIHEATGHVFVTQNSMFKQEARSRSVKVFKLK